MLGFLGMQRGQGSGVRFLRRNCPGICSSGYVRIGMMIDVTILFTVFRPMVCMRKKKKKTRLRFFQRVVKLQYSAYPKHC